MMSRSNIAIALVLASILFTQSAHAAEIGFCDALPGEIDRIREAAHAASTLAIKNVDRHLAKIEARERALKTTDIEDLAEKRASSDVTLRDRRTGYFGSASLRNAYRERIASYFQDEADKKRTALLAHTDTLRTLFSKNKETVRAAVGESNDLAEAAFARALRDCKEGANEATVRTHFKSDMAAVQDRIGESTHHIRESLSTSRDADALRDDAMSRAETGFATAKQKLETSWGLGGY